MTTQRIGPLTIQLQGGEVILTATDVDAIVAAARSWARTMEEGVARRVHARPDDPDALEAQAANDLADALLAAPGGFSAKPVVLDDEQTRVLRKVLAQAVGIAGSTWLRKLDAAL